MDGIAQGLGATTTRSPPMLSTNRMNHRWSHTLA